jgi:disulfide bond formation protein DsbB
VLALLASGFGAFTAARQSWLQWYPPEFAMCGRDFYGMIENYPISRAIPMIFRGSGDCTARWIGPSWAARLPTGLSSALWVLRWC